MPEPVPAPARFTLRQLPLPAKLVVTCFLLTVGLGYTSAMVQLHMQHGDRDGTALPTVDNVVAVFAGKTKAASNSGDGPAACRLETIISGSPTGGLTGSNMTPAFFDKDDADYKKLVKQNPERKDKLDAERNGERQAVIAWVRTAPGVREQAYANNEFQLPPDRVKEPISDAYRIKGKPGVVLIKYVLRDRCARCHTPGGEKGDVPLSTYEELAKFMPAAPAPSDVAAGYVDSGRQMSLEKLTQSTHAHLLSFAVLFTLTGLVFAFTSYPAVVRGIVGPVVLVAQAADVSCWWLARLPNVGVYFAMAIIATGGVVGMGLGAQIVLSLFNMYGPKGKAVLVALALAAGAGAGWAYIGVIDPHLKGEKEKAAAKAAASQPKSAATLPVKPEVEKDNPKPIPAANDAGNPLPASSPTWFEVVVDGDFKKGGPFSGKPKSQGGMVRAFFDKDDEFKDLMKKPGEQLAAATEERTGERDAVLAWVRSAPEDRKKAYEADALLLPPDLARRPLTPAFKSNDTTVRIKSLLGARCAVCHGPGGDKEEAPLTKYEEFEKYFVPASAAKE